MAFKIPAADRPRTPSEALELTPGIMKQVQEAVSDIRMSSDEAAGIVRSLKEAFRPLVSGNTDGWSPEQLQAANAFGTAVDVWIFSGKQGVAFEDPADRDQLEQLVTQLSELGK